MLRVTRLGTSWNLLLSQSRLSASCNHIKAAFRRFHSAELKMMCEFHHIMWYFSVQRLGPLESTGVQSFILSTADCCHWQSLLPILPKTESSASCNTINIQECKSQNACTFIRRISLCPRELGAIRMTVSSLSSRRNVKRNIITFLSRWQSQHESLSSGFSITCTTDALRLCGCIVYYQSYVCYFIITN